MMEQEAAAPWPQQINQSQTEGTCGVSNPQRVSRRSIRSGSEIRHGRVYEDAADTTIRAVTPESAGSATFGISENDILQLSPQSTRPFQGHSTISGREPSASVSNTDEEGAADSRRRKIQRKSKTRADLAADASPSSFISKTRRRLGSITTSGSPVAHFDDMLTQSPTSHAVSGEFRPQPPKPPRRTVSSDSTVSPLRSPLFPDGDNSRKLLQLMKTTCGRMHGILFFRALDSSAWESGYCAINVAPGTLVCQRQGENSPTTTLLPDLRGCSVRTSYESDTRNMSIIVVLPATGLGYQFRPPIPETFDSWLAALLCWQPLRPKGAHYKKLQPLSIVGTERRPLGPRRLSDVTNSKSTSTVKVGSMLLWNGPLPAGSQRHLSRRSSEFDVLPSNSSWQRTSCVLHENGVFRLSTEANMRAICSIKLSQLSRCAVQRLDDSVLDAPYCLAIYLQYTVNSLGSSSSRPLVLGLESKSAYEAWYVLLRSLTVPELYGPDVIEADSPKGSGPVESDTSNTKTFRIERSLTVKITEAKLSRDSVLDSKQGQLGGRVTPMQRAPGGISVYTDVLLGKDLRARTTSKNASHSAFWAEEFCLPDVPPVLPDIEVSIKIGNTSEQEWTMNAQDAYEVANPDVSQVPNLSGLEITSNDPDFGSVNIQIEQLEKERSIEKWWSLTDKHGRNVGSILMKLALAETVVLMESEYARMQKLLHTFDNGLTTQLAHYLNKELKSLSDVLLDIFQASDSVPDWINALIEEEIDGIYKQTPPPRMRFSSRIRSNDSYENTEQRELLVRDLSRSATMEANLLFRGNSLVTKALDAHMKRLGTQYLETTLGDPLRMILRRNPECEVDPTKLGPYDNLDRNWANLISLTSEIWQAIASSASRCPPGMRMIFKHIRSCAEDRYGSFIRTVKYTSVSGFLFLRFFCPAVLNPKLFGLIEDHPPDRPRRTFTLIAKSLNVLASTAKFGTKETWMEPMNKFLQQATPEFRRFIDEMSSFSSLEPTKFIEPQFQAPMQIRTRLAQTSREGLPTLPYLLDAPRSLATLVDLWIQHAPATLDEQEETDVALREFCTICEDLQRRTNEVLLDVESADKPDGGWEPHWRPVLDDGQQVRSLSVSPFGLGFRGSNADSEITALPQRTDSLKAHPRQRVERKSSAGAMMTLSSITTTSGPQRAPYRAARTNDNFAFNSTNSSTLSFDTLEDGRKQSISRVFDSLNPLRKKTRGGIGGDRTPIEQYEY